MENVEALGLIGVEYTRAEDNKKRVFYTLKQHLPLLIDFSKKEHSLIIAKSGSGKSYLAGVIAEEVIRALGSKYGIVIIDPMGIYHSLEKPGDLDDIRTWNSHIQHNLVKAKGMKNIEVWVPFGDQHEFESEMYHRVFSLKATQLTTAIFAQTFKMDGIEPQVSLYRKGFSYCRKEKKDFNIYDLINIIREKYLDWYFKSATLEALICKIDILVELGIITSKGVILSEIVQEGKITIIDVSMSDTFTSRIIVNFLAQSMLRTRKRMKRIVDNAREQKKLIPRPVDYIPHVYFMLDEAHKFTTQIINTYIKEGRNCGCQLLAISQSPDLNKDTYSNICHLYVGQLVYRDDLDGVQKMLPIEKKPGLFRKQIKSLDVGNFVYYNTTKKIEKRIRVRPRKTMHPATTDIQDEKKYFIKDYKIQTSLLEIIGKKGSMKLSDLPKELVSECGKMIKSGKIKQIVKEEGAIVELC